MTMNEAEDDIFSRHRFYVDRKKYVKEWPNKLKSKNSYIHVFIRLYIYTHTSHSQRPSYFWPSGTIRSESSSGQACGASRRSDDIHGALEEFDQVPGPLKGAL